MPRTPAGAATLLAAALVFFPVALAPATAASDATSVGSTSSGDISQSVVDADGPVTWSVEPSPTAEGGRRAFTYDVDPGTQIVDSFLITNAGDVAADFIVYATDAFTDPDTASFSLLSRDEPPTDLGSWIAPAVETVTIDPGMQATIPFNLVIPSDATPGDHSAGVIAAVLTESENAEGSAVVLEQRVGARVYMTVSGAAVAGAEVQGLTSSFTPSLNPFAPGELTVRYDVRNTGNKRIDVEQALRAEGIFGIAVGSDAPEPVLNLLPRQLVHVEVKLTGVAALLYAQSTVRLTPGPVGSATEPGSATGESAIPTPTPAASEPVAADPAATTTGAPIDPDQSAVDYEKVSSQTTTIAITWTLLALIALIIALVFFVVRYVRGTRERMYEAIDEAAEAARQEALLEKESDTAGVGTR